MSFFADGLSFASLGQDLVIDMMSDLFSSVDEGSAIGIVILDDLIVFIAGHYSP